MPKKKAAAVEKRPAGTNASRSATDLLAFARKIIEAAPVGLITYDSTGQCISANDAIAAAIGATVEQLLSQNFRRIELNKTAPLRSAVAVCRCARRSSERSTAV